MGFFYSFHTCQLSPINSESPCFGATPTLPPYFAKMAKSPYFEGISLIFVEFLRISL